MTAITTPEALDAALRRVWVLHPDDLRPDFDATAELDRRTDALLARVAPKMRDVALARLTLMKAAADGMLPPV